MAEENATLATFYDSWRVYQEHLAEAIAPLTAEELALRAAPELRTVGEIALHIIVGRIGWFAGFLGEGLEDMAALGRWVAPEAPSQDATELAQGLALSWELVASALGRWSVDDMGQTFPQEWRGKQYELSRSWVVWHVLEHDLHHGGEISLALGMHGLQAPDI